MLNVAELPDLLSARRTGFHHHSQEEAGVAIGVKQRAVSDWEAGKALPSPRYYRALAKYLGMPEREVAAAIDSERLARARRGQRDLLDQLADRIEQLENETAKQKDELLMLRGQLSENRETMMEILNQLRRRPR